VKMNVRKAFMWAKIRFYSLIREVGNTFGGFSAFGRSRCGILRTGLHEPRGLLQFCMGFGRNLHALR
ncbi:MAG: hypothetical protein IIW61_00985, partial [Bacteroidaceae bacterium]|nr:hypothetical protein [Bacteroidaceae bacterium]